MLEVRDRGLRERVEVLRFLVAAVEFAETAKAQVRAARGAALRPPAAVSAQSEGQCGEPYPPCSTRQRESGGNYRAVNPSGSYRGAWQFSQSTWNGTAARAGRADLVGVPPDQASVADQDEMARVLWDSGRGCAHWSGPAGNEC